MPETAPAQVQRLIELIAWMSQRDTNTSIPYRAAAKHLGVSKETVRRDLDALVALSDEFKPWLASLSVAIVADGFVVESRGSFRRPFRLTPEESLALMIGLAAGRNGTAIAKKLGSAIAAAPSVDTVETSYALGPTPSAHVEQVLSVARQARDERRKLDINYCGSAGEPASRVVHVHQVVQHGGVWYLVAWCERVHAFRHFRADRVLEAKLLVQDFKPQILFQPVRSAGDLLRADRTITATVAFSARIARWLKERYPNGREGGDGRYLVEFRVADPAWLAREVLQYGAEAEVVEPPSLREAVKKVVA